MKIVIKQRSGVDLVVDAKYNSTISDIRVNINNFRAPDNQIKSIYNKDSKILPLNVPIRGELIAYAYQVRDS